MLSSCEAFIILVFATVVVTAAVFIMPAATSPLIEAEALMGLVRSAPEYFIIRNLLST